MEKAPKNAMIGQDEENTKKGGKRKLGEQVQKFYFPKYRKEVVASSYEEALAIINKEESKK